MNRTLTKGQKTTMTMPVEIKAIDKDNFRLTMVASTQSVDRHGDTIMQEGWDLRSFKANPVILNSHNYSDVTEVIARAENTRIEGTGKSAKLVQDWIFAVDANPKAEIAWKLYAGKFLHASSVGFIPHKFKQNKDGSTNYFIIEEAELLEVSAVSVPANAMALLAKSIGVDVKDLEGVVDVDDEAPEPVVPQEEAPAEETTEDTTITAEKIEEMVEAVAAVAEEAPAVEEAAAEEIAPEAVVEQPVEVRTESYSVKVVRAIHNMESHEKRAYRKAHAIISSLLNEETQKVGRATREQIRQRKVNQAIRELLKTK